MSKAAITTHILNLDSGTPAAGVKVSLFNTKDTAPIASAVTDKDGRILQWDSYFALQLGTYRLEFAVGDWFSQQGRSSFYPEVQLTFNVTNTAEHYHLPLLLNAYGYSTYRGS